ncbi:hypothetical protein B0H14DRAFT_3534930 [Mycena olivaceomarginata]|nr:hypothetical protein B0H14DRAFT_3534930 [Mycena olivaceomarginata]
MSTPSLMSHSTSGHSPTTASVSTASSTHRGPYSYDPDPISVPGAKCSPLLAPLSFRPSLEVGIDLGHALDAPRGITNFDSIFRALSTRPFHSCFAGRWYLNTISSGAPACSSVYPLCRLGELFFPADPDEEPFGFCHFEPGGRFLSIRPFDLEW